VLDDASDDDAAAEAVIREVAENRPAPAPTGGTTVREAAIGRNLSQEQKRAIRAWGRSQGMKVGVRGPMPKEVIEAFFARNPEFYSPKLGAYGLRGWGVALMWWV